MTLIVANTYRAANAVARTHGLHRDQWRLAREWHDVIGRQPDQVLYAYDANQVSQRVFDEIALLDAKGMIGRSGT